MTPEPRADARAGTLIIRDQLVVYASEGLAALLGRRVDEIVGRSWVDLVVPEQRSTIADRNRRRVSGEPVPQRYELFAALPGGGRCLVELDVEEDGGDFLIHVRDLSTQEARRLRLDSVATLGAAIQHERTEEAIHARIRSELRELGLSSALLAGDAEGVRVVWACVPAEFSAGFLAATGSPFEGYAGRWSEYFLRLWKDGAAFAEDFALEASRSMPEAHADEMRRLVGASGMGRAAAVRVEQHGREQLYLVVAGDWLRPEDLPAVRLFGAQLAAALGAARAIADLSRRNADLATLNRVAELAGESNDLATFFERAASILRDATGCIGTAVFVLDETSEQLVRVYEHGAPRDVVHRYERLPLEGPRGEALRHRTPHILEVPASGPGAELAELGFRTLAWVPLLVRSKAVGMLTAGFGEPEAAVRERLELLSAVCSHFASAVESQALLARLRRRLSDVEALHALAQRVFENAPGDVTALLQDGCREAAAALGCRGAALFLVAEGGILCGTASWGIDVDVTKLRLSVDSDALAADVLLRRVPAWTLDVTRDPRSSLHGRPGFPPLAMIAVPVVSRDATRGVLFLGDDAGRAFTGAEIALANALAGELAVGLENAELYADLRGRVEELSLLNEMARTVAASLDLEAVLRDGVEAARRLLDGSRGFVALYDPIRSELRFGAGAGYDGAFASPPALPLAEAALLADVIRERRPFVVEDAEKDTRILASYRARWAPRALVAAPLLLRGEPLGVIFIDETRGPRRFTAAEVDRVAAVASHLAVAIENARLYAEARGRLSELSTVIDVARVVSSSLELEEVLEAGAEHLKRTLRGSACTILLDDLRARELRRAASRGAPLGPERVALDAGSLAREALDARAPVTGRLGPGDAPDEAVLAVPLHVRDQPVGVALVGGGAPDRIFAPGELARATAIASQLAVAVDNARLYSETRRRAEQLGLMHEVGRSLVATLEIERVLETGVRNLARIVDAPEAYLALATTDGAELEIRATAGTHPETRGARLPLAPPDATLASLAFHRREPLIVEDARGDPRFGERLRDIAGEGGCLALPLVVRDRTIGTVLIADPRAPRRFTPAEVERAAAIANQLAVAVENARLYEDLRRSYADLARAQQQVIQGERLAALGELSAIVAHEVRNPLGVIFNSLGSLRRLLQPSGDAKMLLDIVGEEADRLNRIVGDLLDFARPSTPQLRPERLDRIVDDALGAALVQARSVQIAREVDAAVPPVPMDARLVRQAVLNVAVNAVQAMPRGGRITVRTLRDGESALLEIEDTGPGIPDEVRGRIFEPFFTTKASGTGLGLAVVKRIVEGHGGAVSVRSRPGRGTVFVLRFPLGGGSVENGPAMG